MKKNIILSGLLICLLVSGVVFTSCDDPGASVVYPQIIPYVAYMGKKAGLTSSSTDQAFLYGLYETFISYAERQPITENEVAFDGVVYGFADPQEISHSDIPQNFRELCLKEFDKKYYKDVGSCFFLQCVEIPGKKETGRYYFYIFIISKVTEEAYYFKPGFAFTGDIYPIR